jgi:hypothetical protein
MGNMSLVRRSLKTRVGDGSREDKKDFLEEVTPELSLEG